MMLNRDKWRLVDALAEKAGVRPETRKKWRIRGVPPAWQIKFVAAASPGLLSFSDFEREPKSEVAA
jgi:hypothetical protein